MGLFSKIVRHIPNPSSSSGYPGQQRPSVNQQQQQQQQYPVGQQQQQQQQQPPPTGQGTAPKIVNLADGEHVYSKVLVVFGEVGPKGSQELSQITVFHHENRFPPLWGNAAGGFFKTLVYLIPGRNDLTFTYYPHPSLNLQPGSTKITVNFHPLVDNPPLHLAIMMAKDSPGTFDTTPEKQRDGDMNDLNAAIRKLRVAACLWQAFTAEQMWRNGFGKRSFPLYETVEHDTLGGPQDSHPQRETPYVHIIKSDKTMSEFRDPDVAQQNHSANKAGDLFGFALEAIKNSKDASLKRENQKENGELHIAVLILDAHWDRNKHLLLAHAALGGGADYIRLGIFGSHLTYTWPNFLGELPGLLLDCRKSSQDYVSDDNHKNGSYWEGISIGVGAMMHEVGHSLGLPHRPNGIMLAGYDILNRTYSVIEGPGANTPGKIPCLPNDEAWWHRTDVVIFLNHPCFRLPGEPGPFTKSEPMFSPVEENGAILSCPNGIYLIEVEVDGSLRGQIEFIDNPQQQVFMTGDVIRQAINDVNFKDPNKTLRINICGRGEGKTEIHNFQDAIKPYKVDESGCKIFKGNLQGYMASTSRQVFLPRGVPISCVRIRAGSFIDGIEIFFADNRPPILYGGRGGNEHDFVLNVNQGEVLIGFMVRAGAWLDAVQVITNQRRGPKIGGNGGSARDLVPPPSHEIAGLYGSSGDWINQLGLLYRKIR